MVRDEIICKEDALALPSGSPVVGYAYIRSYTEQPTKNSGTFLAGHMNCIGDIPFKVWGGTTLNQMKETPLADTICYIHGEVNEYAGSKSIIIKDICSYTGDELVPEDFLELKYDAEELYEKLHTLISHNVSTEALTVFDMVITPIKERFCKEYAAVSHHDACMSGLLAHTTKLVRLIQIMKFYPEISRVLDKDILFVGSALHDIGKTLEYNNGSVSDLGMKMSHLTLGLKLLEPYKNDIIRLKGETFYSDLESIIQQHHGEYGERPRTMVAYIIHIIDGLEAQLTDIDDIIGSASSNQVKVADYRLSF